MAKFNVIVNIKDSDEKLQEFDIVLNKKEETPTEDEGALECINTVLINEYNIERNKRTSFENRALGILAFNSAILSIFLNKYKILVLKAGLQKALTYYLFIKIGLNKKRSLKGCVFSSEIRFQIIFFLISWLLHSSAHYPLYFLGSV